VAERLDRSVVKAAGIMGDAQADVHPLRVGIKRDAVFENFNGRFDGLVEEQFVPPVKEVLFVGVHVRGKLVFLERRDWIAQSLVGLPEQVVEFGSVFPPEHVLQ